MEEFIRKHRERVVGVLEGWDRLLFRGTFRSIAYAEGLGKCLNVRGVLLKDFAAFSRRCTELLDRNARALAERAGRPYRYLASAAESKERVAAGIAAEDGVTGGLVCVLSCVEPCHSFELRRDRTGRRLELVCVPRKCRFFYFYYVDERFGMMHVRLQSWLPFDVQVCVNGRSYLQRQLDRAAIGYEKADNCFRRVDDPVRAQSLLDGMTGLNWPGVLGRLTAPLVRPLVRKGAPLAGLSGYYWTVRQSEWATDVMFRDAAALAAAYPALCRHAVQALGSQDVLRFLGHRRAGEREVGTDLRRRPEGVRVRHHAGANAVKMYDKQGSVLRIETTINDPARFRVLRRVVPRRVTAQGRRAKVKAKVKAKAKSPQLAWYPMRKSVADIARRAEVSRGANHRYLEALSAVDLSTPAHCVLDPVSRGVARGGRHSRGLHPASPEDARLLSAVLDGGHLINGLTNRDLQARLYDREPRDGWERKRRCGWVSRRLRLLRDHGLLHKVGRQRLYRITPAGHRLITVALAVRGCAVEQLRAA